MMHNVLFSPPQGCETLTEWEYLPPVGPRPNKGFVGLKNAGATCYMNSVIQQLYMIPPIRNGILAIEGTGTDVDDDMSGDEKQENEVKQPHILAFSPGSQKHLKFLSPIVNITIWHQQYDSSTKHLLNFCTTCSYNTVL